MQSPYGYGPPPGAQSPAQNGYETQPQGGFGRPARPSHPSQPSQPTVGYGNNAYGHYVQPAYNSAVASMPPPGHPRPPDLAAKATSNAWKMLGMSVGGLLLGALITVVGAVTGIIAIIGLILVVICLVAIPMSIYRLFDPTNYGSLSALGPNSLARKRVFKEVEAEMMAPATWRVQASGGTLYLTGRYFVLFGGSDLEVVRAEDMIWIWFKTKRSGRIFKTEKHFISFKTRKGHKGEIALSHFDHHVMPTLTQAFPHAFFGFDRQLERTPIQTLAWEVDRRRAASLPR